VSPLFTEDPDQEDLHRKAQELADQLSLPENARPASLGRLAKQFRSLAGYIERTAKRRRAP
jgi:hypothetical protein